MSRALVLMAAFLIAAPVFAHDRDDDDDDRWSGDDDYSYQQPPPDDGPTLDDFRTDDQLRWNGEWIDTPEYGMVWRPTRVNAEWRPYTYGHWEWTDLGWAWVSDEPFGWATYHYGRWAFVDDAGWVWLPGRVWAPAWVAWRWGDGVVGWCPLGPRMHVYERPTRWVFVEQRYMVEPVHRHVMPVQVARPWWGRAHALPVSGGPHAGPSRYIVERSIGRELRAAPIVEAHGPRAMAPASGQVVVYRPHSRPFVRQPSAAGQEGWGRPSQDDRRVPHAQAGGPQAVGDQHGRGSWSGGPGERRAQDARWQQTPRVEQRAQPPASAPRYETRGGGAPAPHVQAGPPAASRPGRQPADGEKKPHVRH